MNELLSWIEDSDCSTVAQIEELNEGHVPQDLKDRSIVSVYADSRNRTFINFGGFDLVLLPNGGWFLNHV